MRSILIILLFTPFLAFAQQPAPASGQDIKVGLVLSGGGAKGMAHIGALKVIEEAGVRIDFIGGTSMGAIVGALYSSGYTATQLDSLFKSNDFSVLIQDELPRTAKPFYEKEAEERYALTLPFQKFKVSIPAALSGGQNIYNELVEALYHVKDISDFNELPIPFFCIATDVETGEEVLLNKGYLPEAIMASGTFPSLFMPAEVDGRILIDGGVLNNYPIDRVRALGADIIIGVDVQHGLRGREELNSATEVLLQINNYRTVGQMEEKRLKTDVYIKPDMQQYSVIDFEAQDSIVAEGTRAARKQWDALKGVAGKQTGVRQSPPITKAVDSLVINRLIIRGNSSYSRGFVKGKLRFDLSEKIAFKELQEGIVNLAATNNFATIRYELISNGIGEDLILYLQEDPVQSFIRFGLHYDDLYKTAGLLNYTKKKLLADDDLASLDLILGDHIRYNAEYFVDKGSYWSFGINSRYNSFDEEVDYSLIQQNFSTRQNPDINVINLDVTDLTNQIYFQTTLREEFAFSLGIEHKLLKYSTRTLNEFPGGEGDPVFQNSDERTYFENSNYFSAFGQLTLDTYDDKYFPTRGLYFDGDFHLYLFSSDFNDNFSEFSIGKARMGAAFPLWSNLSLNLETEGGFKLGVSSITSLDFVLGGFGAEMINNFVPFLGYDFLSLPGNSYVKAYGRLDWEFARNHHIMFSLNYANAEDDLFRTGEWFTAPDYSGYGIGYGWASFFGPVQLLYSWSPEIDNNVLFFSVGYWF